MIYFRWICVLMLISGVYSQCSGQKKTMSVGYSASSVSIYDNGYPTDITCSWQHSSSQTGSSILVQINSTVDCPGDSLVMYDGTGNTGALLHSCSDTTPRYIVATGKLFTYFTSDNNPGPPENGFKFNVISARDFSNNACSNKATLYASTSTQCISSPEFPETYPVNTKCNWKIEKTGDKSTLELTFMFIDIEYDATGPCSFDYINIIDEGTGSTVIKTCGEDQWFPSKTYTTNNNVTIEFYSDATATGRGFLLTYFIQSSPSDDDTTNCYFSNCVVLPVMVAVGGVIIIAIITGVILCVVSKQYLKKNMVDSITPSGSPLRMKASFRKLFIPKLGSNRHPIKSAKNPFKSDKFISSKPPIATSGASNLREKHDENGVVNDSRHQIKTHASRVPKIPPVLLKIIHETAKLKTHSNETQKKATQHTTNVPSSRDKKLILDSLNSNKTLVREANIDSRNITKRKTSKKIDGGTKVTIKKREYK